MRLTTLLIISSALLLLSGCEHLPDTNVCGVDVTGLSVRCYNIKRDYDAAGNRKPDAKPDVVTFPTKEAMLDFLNKKIFTDAQGLANLKAFLDDERDACQAAQRTGD